MDEVKPVGDQHEGGCCDRCQDMSDFYFVDWAHICCCRSIAASDDRDGALDAIRTVRLRRQDAVES